MFRVDALTTNVCTSICSRICSHICSNICSTYAPHMFRIEPGMYPGVLIPETFLSRFSRLRNVYILINICIYFILLYTDLIIYIIFHITPRKCAKWKGPLFVFVYYT